MKNRILAYHSVGEHSIKEIGARLYSVVLERFKEQMSYLRNTQYSIPNTTITFDDGDITNYLNAYPVLKEFGLKGYFFIICPWVGTDGYMDWNQIRELQDAGMTIGSHGMTHRILTELRDDELDYELTESKNILEENLKTKIDYFSIPRGFCNERVIDSAKRAGYKKIFTSDVRDMDGFRLGRIVVRADWDLDHFTKVLDNGYLIGDRAEYMMKNSLRKILGSGNYDKLRTAVLRHKGM